MNVAVSCTFPTGISGVPNGGLYEKVPCSWGTPGALAVAMVLRAVPYVTDAGVGQVRVGTV